MTKENPEVASLPISDLMFSLWKNKLKIIIFAMVGGLLGIFLTFIKQTQSINHPTYEVNAAIAVLSKNQDGMFGGEVVNPGYYDVETAKEMMEAVCYVARSNIVLNKVIEQQKLIGVESKDIKRTLNLERYMESQIITIQFTWDDRDEGVRIVSSLIDILPNVLIQTLELGSVEVVDMPEVEEIIASGGSKYFLLGVALGIFLVLCYSFLTVILRPTFITGQSIEEMVKLSVMGEIPYDSRVSKMRNNAPISDEEYTTSDVFRESYSTTARIVQNCLDKKQKKALCVTSVLAGEGKTTVAAHLALHLSEFSKKVLLVDLDVRKPSLGNLFLSSLEYASTLNAIYFDGADAKDVCIHVNEYLDVIPAMLEKEKVKLDVNLQEKIQELMKDYDYVLFDVPSVGVVADPLSLTGITDQVLLVIKQNKTWKELIIDSMDKIEKSGNEIFGCILNEVDMTTPGNYYYYKNMRGKEAHVKKSKKRRRNDDFVRVHNTEGQTTEGQRTEDQISEGQATEGQTAEEQTTESSTLVSQQEDEVAVSKEKQ